MINTSLPFCFEALSIGPTFHAGSAEVTADPTSGFAVRFDPQSSQPHESEAARPPLSGGDGPSMTMSSRSMRMC